jgi:hypothetical protein
MARTRTTKKEGSKFDAAAESILRALESSRPNQELGALEIKDARAEFSTALRDLRLREQGISAAEDEQSLIARLDAEFRDIIQNPQVVQLELVAKPLRLKVYTTELLCKDPRTEATHFIGNFKIYINFRNDPEHDSVVWINRIQRVQTPIGVMEAPHVLAEGGACLGNMTGVFEDLISRGQYSTAVVMAIAFIETVNVTDDWGKHVNLWPVVQGRRSNRSR